MELEEGLISASTPRLYLAPKLASPGARLRDFFFPKLFDDLVDGRAMPLSSFADEFLPGFLRAFEKFLELPTLRPDVKLSVIGLHRIKKLRAFS